MPMRRFVFLLFLGFLCFRLTAQNQDNFARAESYFRQDKWGAALSEYQLFINESPLSDKLPHAYFRKGQILFYQKNYAEARKQFRFLSTKYAGTELADYSLFYAAACSFYLDQYNMALSFIERFLTTVEEPKYRAKALLLKGRVVMQLAKKDQALAVFLDVLPQLSGQDQSTVLYFVFSILREKSDLQRLFELYQKWAQQLDSPYLDLMAGEAALFLGKMEECLLLIRPLSRKEGPLRAKAYLLLLDFYISQQDFQKAQEILREAEKNLQKQECLALYKKISLAYIRQNKIEQASPYLELLWQEREDFKDWNYKLGFYWAESLKNSGENSRAAEIIKKILAENTFSTDMMPFLSSFYSERGDWENLLKLFEQYDQGLETGSLYLKAYANYKAANYNRVIELCKNYRGKDRVEDFVRLHMLSLLKLNQRREAKVLLRSSFSSRKLEESSLRLDYLRLLFQDREYWKVDEEGTKALALINQGNINLRDYYLLQYYTSLARMAQKNYQGGLQVLENWQHDKAMEMGLTEAALSVLFYRAWAYYKLYKLEKAVPFFKMIVDDFSDREMAVKSRYYLAWCYYSSGQFKQAEKQLQALLAGKSAETWQEKARFLLAKSFHAQQNYQSAEEIYKKLISSASTSFKDELLFEYAQFLKDRKQYKRALELFKQINLDFPDSPLREEALYQQAMLLYSAESYTAAEEIFYQYRQSYPRGDFLDAAYYWGGLASFQIEKYFEAALLWNKLIEDFPKSPFRPDALYRLARINSINNDYQSALEHYKQLKREYPKAADGLDVDSQIRKLSLVLQGKSDEEAKLSVLIGQNQGSKTTEGREAMLALARFYLYRGTDNLDLARDMLLEIIQKAEEDPARAARAYFLLGEYWYRQADRKKAANFFLKAAVMDPQKGDLLAAGLYRAAEMLVLEGRKSEARGLVQRLQQHFPHSAWAKEAQKLLESD